MGVAPADYDLRWDEGVVVLGIGFYGEEGRHARSRVVAGTAGEDREGADDFVGVRVEKEGAVVGEDKKVAISGEMDKRVEVVLVRV